MEPVNRQLVATPPPVSREYYRQIARERSMNTRLAAEANKKGVVNTGLIGELEAAGNRYINARGRLRGALRGLGAAGDDEDA